MTTDDSSPLAGTRVLVSRPAHQSKELVDKLSRSGAEVLAVPAIALAPPTSWKNVDQVLQSIERFDVIVFTSANGVKYFFERLQQLSSELTIPKNATTVAIGPATAKMLEKYDCTADVIPPRFISDDIAEALGDLHGKRVLLPRADIARKQLTLDLIGSGAEVTEVAMYRVETNRSPEWINTLRNLTEESAPDYITVTSSSTAKGISEILESAGKSHWLKKSQFVCIGPITASTVEELGHTPNIVADVYTTDGIFNALIKEKKNG